MIARSAAHDVARASSTNELEQMVKHCMIGLVTFFVVAQTAVAQSERDIAVRKDKQELSTDVAWVYDDLATAIVDAEKTKRPLMIVFR